MKYADMEEGKRYRVIFEGTATKRESTGDDLILEDPYGYGTDAEIGYAMLARWEMEDATSIEELS